ncbi:hypothetical protein GN956_G16938 [Arapaima gigas]
MVTTPRSKGPLSRSETDLHRKKFRTFSFTWKKTKKKKPVAGLPGEPAKPDPPGLGVQEWQKEQEEEINDAGFEEVPWTLSPPSELTLLTVGCLRGSALPDTQSQTPHYISMQHCFSEEHQFSSTRAISSEVLPCSSDTCNPVALDIDSSPLSTGPSSSDQFETESVKVSPPVPVKTSDEHEEWSLMPIRRHLFMGDTNLGGIPPSAVDVPQAYTNLTNPDRSSDRYVSDSALTEPLDHPHPLGDDQDSSGLSDTPKIRQGTVPLDPGLASNDTCLADVGTSLAESNSPSQLSSQGGSRDHPIVRNASPCSWSQDDPSRSSQSKIIEKRLLNAAFTVFNSRSSSLPLPTAELRNEDPSDLRGSSSFPSSAESLCSESHPSVSECTVPYTSVYHYHAGDRVNQGMGATLEDHVVDTMEEHSVAELRMEEMGDNSDNQDAEAKMETQAVDVMERQATEAQILATNTCSGGQESKTWTVNLPRELQQSDGMATNNSSENNQAAFVSAASEVMTVKAAAAVDLLLPQEVTKEEQRAKVTPFWKCEGGGVKWTADMMHKGGQQEGENMQAEEQLKERGTKEQVENAGWEEIQGALGVSGHGGELKDNKEEEPEHPRGREQEPEPPVPQVCMSEECWAASPTLESEEAEPNEGARPSERMATSSQLGSENQLRGKETTHGKELWSRKAENTVTDNKETIQTDTASSTEEPAENPERAAAGEETPPAIHSPGQAKRVPPLTRGEVSTGSAEG